MSSTIDILVMLTPTAAQAAVRVGNETVSLAIVIYIDGSFIKNKIAVKLDPL